MSTITENAGSKAVLHTIRQQISDGKWQVGQKIPSERQLEKELSVSRLTIHKSLSLLAAQGWLIRRRGSGTYVADRSQEKRDKAVLLTYISPIAPSSAGPVHRGITEGLYDAHEARREKGGYHITVEFYRTPEEQREVLLRVSDETHAGFAVWYEPENLDVLEQLVQSGYPVVILDAYDEQKCLDCVVTDNETGSRLMVDYLVSRGHQMIGYVTRPNSRSSLIDRQSGFYQAMVQHGLPFSSNQIAVLEQSSAVAAAEEIPVVVDRLRKQCPNLTAIYFSNDELALAAISHLQSQGVRVPEEMSIVGFDNIFDWPNIMTVPLTTVEQDCYQIGRVAGQIIEERLNKGVNRRPIREFVSPKLVIRSSVGRNP